jgi:transposase
MLTPPASLMIYVATQPVDFRKGAEGLALLAKETLGHDPMKGVAVVFRAKRADRVKIVVWDGSGLVLYWKRLDGSGFKWPPIVAGVMRMNAAQLSALLAWIGRACTHLESRSRKRLRKDINLRCIGARSMADSGQ